MTFSSPDIRHSFHRLDAATQVLFHGIWSRMAQQGYFLEVTEVRGSDVILRITKKPETLTALTAVSPD